MARKLTEEEKKLLSAAMKDVTPLDKKRKKELEELPVVEKPKRKAPSARLPAPPSAPVKPNIDVDQSTLARVKKGDYPIDATLDLHGHTLTEAHARLSEFVENSYRKGRRGLLVITGKGRIGAESSLRKEVPRWLSLSPLSAMILVISSAKGKHGGQGAYYLLLRRSRT